MIDPANARIAEGLKQRLTTKIENGQEVFVTDVADIACYVAEHQDRIIEALEANRQVT